MSATQVEALCELKRALIEDNIPTNKVGLLHSKSEASIPSDTEEQVNTRPFVLVTHNKIKHARTQLDSYFFYNDKQRDLVIWDESLLSGHSINLSVIEIRTKIAEAKISSDHQHLIGDDYLQLITYLDSIDSTLKEAHQSDDRDFQISFNEIPDDLTKLNHLINSLLTDGNDLKYFLLCVNNLDHIRYIKEQNGSIIHFEQTLPSELDSIVVLDASHTLRELTQSDHSIRTINLGCSKTYEDLTINFFKSPCGRQSLENEFRRRTESDLVKEVIDIISTLIESKPEEPILIWSYKKKNNLCIIDTIKSELRKVYPSIDFEQTNSEGHKLFNFNTFGNELGLNSLTHCKHTIFCGLLFQPMAALAMSLKGLSGDMERDLYTDKLLYKTKVSEQAHVFYQAVSRGSSRETINGKCMEHSVYLFHYTPLELKRMLAEVFPQAKWTRYETKYIDSTSSLAEERAVEINNALSELTAEEFKSLCGVNSQSTNKVSTQKVRKYLFPELKPNEWKLAIRAMNEIEFYEWAVVEKSFERR